MTTWPTDAASRQTFARVQYALTTKGVRRWDVLFEAERIMGARISYQLLTRVYHGLASTGRKGILIRFVTCDLTGRSEAYLFGPSDKARDKSSGNPLLDR